MGFGDHLKELRKARKLSQAELAKRSGLSQSAISAFEKGINEPTSVSVQQLARALGIKPGELLGDDPPGSASEDQLTDQERDLLHAFRRLNGAGKAAAIDVVKSLVHQFGAEKNNQHRAVSNE